MARATRAVEKHGIPARSRIVLWSALLLISAALSSATMAQAPDHSRDELRKLNQSVDSLIKKVSPSVVQILVTGYGPLEEASLETPPR